MRLAEILLSLWIATLFQSPKMLAQVSEKICEIPVVVADSNNGLVSDLMPADFAVRFGGKPEIVSSASVDRGPKRIVVILDASGNIPNDEWNLETQAAEQFVRHARPDDQLALLVVGVDDKAELPLLSSGEVAGDIEKLAQSQSPETVYDALSTAENRLNPPQFGDAIILFGHHLDFGSKTSFDSIRELLLRNKTRFYGMSFADRLAKLPPGFDLNKALPKGFGLSKLESLSAETGYFFSFHAVRDLNHPGQMLLFENFLANLYARIAEPYRLKIAATEMKDETEVNVSAADMEARKIHQSGIHYPHVLLRCD